MYLLCVQGGVYDAGVSRFIALLSASFLLSALPEAPMHAWSEERPRGPVAAMVARLQ